MLSFDGGGDVGMADEDTDESSSDEPEEAKKKKTNRKIGLITRTILTYECVEVF